MAIEKRFVAKDPVECVYYRDPCVTVTSDWVGWIPITEGVQLRDGAEIVEICALGLLARAQVRDASGDGFRQKQVARIARGLISQSVYGNNDSRGKRVKVTDQVELGEVVNAWKDDGVWLGLGMAIGALTEGEDLKSVMASVYTPLPKKKADGGSADTKSGDVEGKPTKVARGNRRR